METNINESLFQEIRRLHRRIRQIMPLPHGGAGHPNPPSADIANSDKHPPLRREHILRILLLADQGMRQKEIAELLNVGAPAMSESIDRLEDDNYIERIPDPDDGRATRIVLTEKGKARAYEIQDDHTESLNRLFRNLSGDEKTQLIVLLQKINE